MSSVIPRTQTTGRDPPATAARAASVRTQLLLYLSRAAKACKSGEGPPGRRSAQPPRPADLPCHTHTCLWLEWDCGWGSTLCIPLSSLPESTSDDPGHTLRTTGLSAPVSRAIVKHLPLCYGLGDHSKVPMLLLTYTAQLCRPRAWMFGSVQSDSLRPHEPQHARPPCHPRVYPNPWPLSQWCHPTISSSVVPFSSCPQSLPASGSFPMSQLFTSGGQSIRVSASASVLPMNTQDWSPLGWTGWISLQSKGLSRASSNTTVQKHQFFSAQLSLWSNSHTHTWLLKKP